MSTRSLIRQTVDVLTEKLLTTLYELHADACAVAKQKCMRKDDIRLKSIENFRSYCKSFSEMSLDEVLDIEQQLNQAFGTKDLQIHVNTTLSLIIQKIANKLPLNNTNNSTKQKLLTFPTTDRLTFVKKVWTHIGQAVCEKYLLLFDTEGLNKIEIEKNKQRIRARITDEVQAALLSLVDVPNLIAQVRSLQLADSKQPKHKAKPKHKPKPILKKKPLPPSTPEPEPSPSPTLTGATTVDNASQMSSLATDPGLDDDDLPSSDDEARNNGSLPDEPLQMQPPVLPPVALQPVNNANALSLIPYTPPEQVINLPSPTQTLAAEPTPITPPALPVVAQLRPPVFLPLLDEEVADRPASV